jgi:hypothetical protein
MRSEGTEKYQKCRLKFISNKTATENKFLDDIKDYLFCCLRERDAIWAIVFAFFYTPQYFEWEFYISKHRRTINFAHRKIPKIEHEKTGTKPYICGK